MKVKTSINKRSPECQFVRREGVLYVICKSNPRLKQRQGKNSPPGKKRKKK